MARRIDDAEFEELEQRLRSLLLEDSADLVDPINDALDRTDDPSQQGELFMHRATAMGNLDRDWHAVRSDARRAVELLTSARELSRAGSAASILAISEFDIGNVASAIDAARLAMRYIRLPAKRELDHVAAVNNLSLLLSELGAHEIAAGLQVDQVDSIWVTKSRSLTLPTQERVLFAACRVLVQALVVPAGEFDATVRRHWVEAADAIVEVMRSDGFSAPLRSFHLPVLQAVLLHERNQIVEATQELDDLVWPRFRGKRPMWLLPYAVSAARIWMAAERPAEAIEILRDNLTNIESSAVDIRIQQSQIEASRAFEALGDHRAAIVSARTAAEVGARAERRLVGSLVSQLDSAADLELVNEGLESESGRLTTIALTDPLTGLSNGRKLDDEVEFLTLAVDELAVVVFTIRDLGEMSDLLGDERVDAALVQFADLLREQTRPVDTVARPRGSEFTVIMPGRTADDANQLAAEVLEAGVDLVDLGTVVAQVAAGDAADANELLAAARQPDGANLS